jgi:hypothetical protein
MCRLRFAVLAVLAICGAAPWAPAADLALVPLPSHRAVVDQHRHRDADGTTGPAQHEILLQQFLKWLQGR